MQGRFDNDKSDFDSRLSARYKAEPVAKKEAVSTSQKRVLASSPPIIDTLSHSILMENYNRAEQLRILHAATTSARNSKAYVYSYIREFRNKEQWIIKHKLEEHKKFTLSFAVIILFLVGAPLGAIIRKGGMGLPVVIAIIIFLFYHILSTTTHKLGKDFVLTPFAAMWISSIVLTPFGLWLTYKSNRDSALFNFDRYWQPIEAFFTRLFKRKKGNEDSTANA